MNLNRSVRISADVLSQDVSGETVLLDLNSENYFGMEGVGTRLWQLLKEHGDLSKIYNVLLQEYEIDEKQLETDLDAIMNELVDAGIIKIIQN